MAKYGPKPLPPAQLRGAQMHVRLLPGEHAELLAWAAREGVALSALARAVLLREARLSARSSATPGTGPY